MAEGQGRLGARGSAHVICDIIELFFAAFDVVVVVVCYYYYYYIFLECRVRLLITVTKLKK